jgi:hypothetical protein
MGWPAASHTPASHRARMEIPLQRGEGGPVVNRPPLGRDVAKQVFQLHGVEEQGQVVVHGSLAGLVAIFR